MKDIIIIVCGGRDYNDYIKMNRILSSLNEKVGISLIFHGDATGADSMAAEWAHSHNISVIAVPADWKTYGKSAGSIRNQKMLDMKPDGVVAFPGGSGTAHMVSIARKAGIPVWEVRG